MMSELRSYQKPPEGVHHVMKAVFLLLGEDEATTTVSQMKLHFPQFVVLAVGFDWSTC